MARMPHLWFSLSCLLSVLGHTIEITFDLFNWGLEFSRKDSIKSHLYIVGPLSIHIMNEKAADEWLDSLFKPMNRMEDHIDEELNQRGEKHGPDGKPLN